MRGQLAKLNTPFRQGVTVTAGNASGVNDFSCSALIVLENAAKTHALDPKARIMGMAVAGESPNIMGISPVLAVEKLTANLNIKSPILMSSS